eukprot:COSAG01_NODE_18555_length_1068_cov_1.359133_1_plen_50_part_01
MSQSEPQYVEILVRDGGNIPACRARTTAGQWVGARPVREHSVGRALVQEG